MKHTVEVMIPEAEIKARIAELGRQITEHYKDSGSEMVLVGLLRGSFMFMADLCREVQVPHEVDFMTASSYGSGMSTTRDVKILKDLDEDIIKSLGLTRDQFGTMTNPATVIGTLTEEVQKMTGLNAIPVIAVAGHDTASAVAAVPAGNEHFAYLSSGTWSLMGIESKDPIITENSFDKNFTNEGGIEIGRAHV